MRPTDCAFLVAIPLDRQEFLDDLAAGADFISSWRATRPTLSAEGLWSIYSPYAGLGGRVFDRVTELGVGSVRRATCSMFIEALMRFQVVTLVAHWRGARFRAGDIRDPVRVAQKIATITASPGFRPSESASSAAPAGTDPISLAACLNQFLIGVNGKPLGTLTETQHAAAETQAQYVMWQRRRAMEQILGDAVSGGPGVEFADGLKGIDDLLPRIPPTYNGTLDLTVCNSALLAEEIRRRCPGGLILSNALETSLDFRLGIYKQIIIRVARRHLSYVEASIAIRKAIRHRQ